MVTDTYSQLNAPQLTSFWEKLVAGAGFAAALAAMSVPQYGSQVSEIAAILSVGALALVAGHRWGLLIVAAADVVLLGTIWPAVFSNVPPADAYGLAAWVALVGTIPGLLVFPRTLPRTVDLVLGREPSPRVRSAALLTGRAATAMWLLAPVVSLS